MTIDEIKRQIFIDSEEVCGNTMIDTYSAQEYVEQAYYKAIDDFAEKFIYKAICEGCSGCCNCYEESRQSECEGYKLYVAIAEQLKKECAV